jgi:3-hydroxyisobutyrate dehydrogenase-like beta-hydroxyacid dehydrogenase
MFASNVSHLMWRRTGGFANFVSSPGHKFLLFRLVLMLDVWHHIFNIHVLEEMKIMLGSEHFRIAVLGFGEAARAFFGGWAESGPKRVVAYDIKIKHASMREDISAACERLGVNCAETMDEALDGATHVFSLVTADKAFEAANEARSHIAPPALFFDCNSCSPATKKAAAAEIEAAGGCYVDVAIMAPVQPARHLTALLIAGPHAERARAALEALGMRPSISGEEIGQASAIKMLRSVMIKGFEALTAECMLAARKAGVEQAVLASLQASDPGFDWQKRSAYNLERMMVHGGRRAAEMREVASTIRELGLSDRMARAITDWQQEIADLDLDGGKNELADRADRILGRLGR